MSSEKQMKIKLQTFKQTIVEKTLGSGLIYQITDLVRGILWLYKIYTHHHLTR